MPYPYYPTAPPIAGQPSLQPPSPSPPKGPADPAAFPTIAEWLRGLDAGVRGVDNDDYQQYIHFFDAARYWRIDELVEFTAKDFEELCSPDMVRGVAARLVRYIREDWKSLKKAR
jgi:hypothetical protein